MRSLSSLIPFLCATALSAQGTAGPCDVFPADNPWNIDISSYPLHPLSATFIASIDAGSTSKRLHPDFGTNPEYGIPYVYVSASQSRAPITYDAYGDESDAGPFPIPLDAPIEGGADATGDRHVIAVDTSACMLYELFAARRDDDGWIAQSGATFDFNTSAYRPDGWTSADAAGLPIFPGLVRYEEIASGAIHHALRFTSRFTQRGWIHPARHHAGRPDTTYPPMGLRLRLRADYDISGYTGQARVIMDALKKYGMILADNGTSWFISGTSDPRWDLDDLNQLKRVPGAAFEAVNTGPTKRVAEVASADDVEVRATQRLRARTDRDVLIIDITLPETSPASVVLVDVRGSMIATVINDNLPSGAHTVRLGTSGIPSGSYLLRLTTPRATTFQRLVVTR